MMLMVVTMIVVVEVVLVMVETALSKSRRRLAMFPDKWFQNYVEH